MRAPDDQPTASLAIVAGDSGLMKTSVIPQAVGAGHDGLLALQRPHRAHS
jgi:hypothetical protein